MLLVASKQALAGVSNDFLSLEELAYYYRTDKAHDDHKYTDVYGALLTPLRATVLNLTEIGIFTGASVQVWHDFFPRARIFGMDLNLGLMHPASRRMLQALPRVTLLQGSAQRYAVAGLNPSRCRSCSAPFACVMSLARLESVAVSET